VSSKAEVDQLTALGVDKIITLTHLGYGEDIALAEAVSGVDIIVGGHSHTILYTSTLPLQFEPPTFPKYSPIEPAGPYSTVVGALNGDPVLIVSAYQWGTFLGNLDGTFASDGTVNSYSGNPIYMANTIVQDPAVESILTPTYKVPIQELLHTYVGTTTVELPIDVGGTRICRTGECLMGNLVADAILWQVNEVNPAEQYQIAFQNGGGLRAGIDGGCGKDRSRRDLFSASLAQAAQKIKPSLNDLALSSPSGQLSAS
jgi:5'-nucleotidase